MDVVILSSTITSVETDDVDDSDDEQSQTLIEDKETWDAIFEDDVEDE